MARDASRANVDVEEQRRTGLRWLAGLRWWALSGAMLGVLVSQALSWRFVSTPAVVGAIVLMVAVNGVLVWRTRRELSVGRNELLLHATVDMGLLTWLLAFAGGVRNPLSLAFSFHVVLGALLNGRRGALFSSGASLLLLTALWGLELADALPVPPLHEPPALLWALSLGLLIVGLGYLALEVAERQTDERERTRAQREDAERALDLLLSMLTALKVGVHVEDADGNTVLENAAGLAGPQTASARERARSRLETEEGDRVTERYTVSPHPVVAVDDVPAGAAGAGAGAAATGAADAGRDRVVELIALRPKHPRVSRAFLTVDRTEGLLVEQRHIMLERLATLGRAMQGVAHELNTPLTTMQTLAKDLQAALAAIELTPPVRADVDESLTLLIEETRRCRSLTQSLLQTANDGRRARGMRLPLVEVAKKAVRLVGAEKEAVFIDDRAIEALGQGGVVDADRVLQILMNLIQNALAATEHLRDDGKGARVVVEATADDRVVRVSVQDRGPGLPSLVRARLFEPFVTTKAEGTGLGLYTSQQLARDLGGSLIVDDLDPGQRFDDDGEPLPGKTGTRAVLTLPRGT